MAPDLLNVWKPWPCVAIFLVLEMLSDINVINIKEADHFPYLPCMSRQTVFATLQLRLSEASSDPNLYNPLLFEVSCDS